MSPRNLFQGIAAIAIVTLAACSTNPASTAVPSTGAASNDSTTGSPTRVHAANHLRAFAADCEATTILAGIGLCTNIELTSIYTYGPTTPAAQVPGLHPADLQSAYSLPSASAGTGQTIGIVIVNDDPSAAADLAVYRSTFRLPACSLANGCLSIVKAKKDLSGDVTWAREASTDIDMASAVCPNCKLVLSEAASTKDSDLQSAVAASIAAGATVVSNSYVIPESSAEISAAWQHPGVPIVAAAGDRGYGAANWPAAASNVIAVGATTLTADSSTKRGWTETAWAETGSGCSKVAAKPVWQTDSGCTHRTVADVAAVGDPQTPVAIYDSYQDNGWVEVGGTSVATPIVAGVYGLAGNGASLTGAASLYAHTANLNPVGAGVNGVCLPLYLCTTSGAGYSGPAGIGSPNGVAAF